LLALRWMNPNALIYLHESRVEADTPARVDYELWDGRSGSFRIAPRDAPARVLAKLMFAARDPAYDPPEARAARDAALAKLAAARAAGATTATAAADDVADDADAGADDDDDGVHRVGFGSSADRAFAAADAATGAATGAGAPVPPRHVPFDAATGEAFNAPVDWAAETSFAGRSAKAAVAAAARTALAEAGAKAEKEGKAKKEEKEKKGKKEKAKPSKGPAADAGRA
jgi:hypothetical protein